jgi:hypothetical protein
MGGKMRTGLLQTLYEWSGVIYVLAVMFGAVASFGIWFFGKQLSAIQTSQIATLGNNTEQLRKDNLLLQKQIITAQAEVAQANERAALLMKNAAWRALDSSQQQRMAAVLRGHVEAALIISRGSDAEAEMLANDIAGAFAVAGITKVQRTISYDVYSPMGVELLRSPGAPQNIVADAFVAVGWWGMEFNPPAPPKQWGEQKDPSEFFEFSIPVVSASNIHLNVPTGTAVIFVGSKYRFLPQLDPKFTAPTQGTTP